MTQISNHELLEHTSQVSFADAAHQTLIFDANDPTCRLILSLIDTRWIQRLRHISQTGNTRLVYMFAEHSRFGHSLGVAYLAKLLMDNLKSQCPEMVHDYEAAVAAAAILHDIGHTAPGSHLAAKVWDSGSADQHEEISLRIVENDPEIQEILAAHSRSLPELTVKVLQGATDIPPWTTAIIAGGGWNADRGNWTIVDSIMCCVSYGRYNVRALLDAFSLSVDGRLILQENRLDALTHFFVARDSMYRQVYQHRVLQAADALAGNIVLRLRDLLAGDKSGEALSENDGRKLLVALNIFCDSAMIEVLSTKHFAKELPLETLFKMTESWWGYHLETWCAAKDLILRDLAERLRHRRLFKTLRLDPGLRKEDPSVVATSAGKLISEAKAAAVELGFDPRYYVATITSSDSHRRRAEEAPLVLLDSGELVEVTQIEPLIEVLVKLPQTSRSWLAVPKSVKEKLGRIR